MKKHITILTLAVQILVFTGCTSVLVQPDKKPEVLPSECADDVSLCYFIREEMNIETAIKYLIKVDGNIFAKLPPSGFTFTYLEPGYHDFKSDTDWSSWAKWPIHEFSETLEGGKVYYFYMKPIYLKQSRASVVTTAPLIIAPSSYDSPVDCVWVQIDHEEAAELLEKYYFFEAINIL